MSHFDNLIRSFQQEWAVKPANPLLQGCELYNDNTRHWWVNDPARREVIGWECRRFPGCDTLIITTKVELRGDLRGRGLGRYFQELRQRAYKRAGFVGELATVRSDNARQNRLMVGAVSIGEFRSDFGGTFKLWLHNLAPRAVVERETNPAIVEANRRARAEMDAMRNVTGPSFLERHAGIQARVHTEDLSQYVLENPDAPALAPLVQAPAQTITPPPSVKYSHWTRKTL